MQAQKPKKLRFEKQFLICFSNFRRSVGLRNNLPQFYGFQRTGVNYSGKKTRKFWLSNKSAKFENSDFLEFCMGINEPEACVQDFSSKEGPYASFEVLASQTRPLFMTLAPQMGSLQLYWASKVSHSTYIQLRQTDSTTFARNSSKNLCIFCVIGPV